MTFCESKYYDQRWNKEDASSHPPNPERVSLVVGEVLKAIGDYPSPRILDVGCGNGWILEAVAQKLNKPCELYGIEPSKAGAENTRKKVSSAKVFEGTLEQSLLKNNCEIVICSEVIEHVIQQNEFVNALAKITTSKGTLILTTPNGRYYEPYVGYYQNKLEFQPVENWLNLNKLSRLFNQFFKIIKVTTFDLSFFYTRHSNVQRLKSFVRELRGGWRLWNVMERGFLTSAYFGLYYFAVMKRKV